MVCCLFIGHLFRRQSRASFDRSGPFEKLSNILSPHGSENRGRVDPGENISVKVVPVKSGYDRPVFDTDH